jgi:hypothetical protein
MNLFAAIAISGISFAAGYLFRRRPKKWICPGGHEDETGFHCGARPSQEITSPTEITPPAKIPANPEPQPASTAPEPHPPGAV